MKYIVIAIVGFILILVLPYFLGFRTIDSGEIGVVRNFGNVTGRTLQPGANFVTPFVDDVLTYNTKLVTYETSTEQNQSNSKADYKDFPVDTTTKDGQPVDIFYTVRFSVDPTRVTEIAAINGSETALVEKIVKVESRSWARIVPKNFSAEELYTGVSVEKVQEQIRKKIEPAFKKNGLILDTILIREINFDNDYVNAVKQKQVEQVKIATEANKALQAEQIKTQRITAAEASAREQELQRTTLSPEVLEKLKIDLQLKWLDVMRSNWKGEYPQYLIIGQDLGGSFLPLPTQLAK